jgi:hypothetical protein
MNAMIDEFVEQNVELNRLEQTKNKILELIEVTNNANSYSGAVNTLHLHPGVPP